MLKPYKRYFDFKGRSSRSEYWLFFLFYTLAIIGTIIVDVLLFGAQTVVQPASSGGPITGLFVLASLIPAFALSFRRLHDIDKSAWWVLIGLIPLIGAIVLLVFAVLPGTPGANRFGPPPGDPPPLNQGTVSAG